jgi:predicted RNA-binding Zn ribbon-like protein
MMADRRSLPRQRPVSHPRRRACCAFRTREGLRELIAANNVGPAVLASLLGTVAEAVASGTWDRLKISRSPDCRRAYYDLSRNRSRAWCLMSVCGNRAKARAFRTRGR